MENYIYIVFKPEFKIKNIDSLANNIRQDIKFEKIYTELGTDHNVLVIKTSSEIDCQLFDFLENFLHKTEYGFPSVISEEPLDKSRGMPRFEFSFSNVTNHPLHDLKTLLQPCFIVEDFKHDDKFIHAIIYPTSDEFSKVLQLPTNTLDCLANSIYCTIEVLNWKIIGIKYIK